MGNPRILKREVQTKPKNLLMKYYCFTTLAV